MYDTAKIAITESGKKESETQPFTAMLETVAAIKLKVQPAYAHSLSRLGNWGTIRTIPPSTLKTVNITLK